MNSHKQISGKRYLAAVLMVFLFTVLSMVLEIVGVRFGGILFKIALPVGVAMVFVGSVLATTGRFKRD